MCVVERMLLGDPDQQHRIEPGLALRTGGDAQPASRARADPGDGVLRCALAPRKAAQAAIRILEIQRDRTQQTMMHAQANADLMQIKSPLDGVVVLNTIWKQGTMGEVQEGDQVRPGVPFMQVINPSTMQVRVMANQQDFPSLQIGQTAKVRLDAYPDLVFPAKLDQLAPIGEGGDFSSKLRSFVVIVSIAGNDPKLMPDLSAAVDVDISKKSAGSPDASSSESAARSGS